MQAIVPRSIDNCLGLPVQEDLQPCTKAVGHMQVYRLSLSVGLELRLLPVAWGLNIVRPLSISCRLRW
jgi:hypothetical protein